MSFFFSFLYYYLHGQAGPLNVAVGLPYSHVALPADWQSVGFACCQAKCCFAVTCKLVGGVGLPPPIHPLYPPPGWSALVHLQLIGGFLSDAGVQLPTARRSHTGRVAREMKELWNPFVSYLAFSGRSLRHFSAWG